MVRWIQILNWENLTWRKVDPDITNLISLKLNVKCRKTLHLGMFHRGSFVPTVILTTGLIDYTPHQEDIWRSTVIAPSFLMLALDDSEWSLSWTCCFTTVESALCTHRRLGGTQNWSGQYEAEKKFLPLLGIKPGSLAMQLIAWSTQWLS